MDVKEHTDPGRNSVLRGFQRAFFVTLNTHRNRALFGSVVGGKMTLNAHGKIAHEQWVESAGSHESLQLGDFIVMPNHVHGIIRLKDNAPLPKADVYPVTRVRLEDREVARFVDKVIADYKKKVSSSINALDGTRSKPVWHRDYWDVSVRDRRTLTCICHYIRFNPQNYDVVMQGKDLRSLGNPDLLKQPKVGFLASKGTDRPHGLLYLRQDEVILSAFASPMERQVFAAALKNKRPMVWVKPLSAERGTNSSAIQHAISAGRLLIVSPFHDVPERSYMRRAAWCNHYVLSQCNRLVVGNLKPDGLLACVLSEAHPDLQINCMDEGE